MLALAFLKIPTTDLDRSVDFYTQGLGLDLLFKAEEFGWAQLQSGDVSLALYVPGKGGGTRTPGGSVDFQLAHADIDGLRDTLAQRFSDCGAAVFDNADGSRSLEFTDPSGNELKIMAAG